MSSENTSYFKAAKLGDFLSELPKSTLPASLASDNGTYPFFCSSSVVKYCNTFIEDKPTVLMGTGGTASVNFGNDKFAYSTDTWAFRSSHEEALTTEYIYRFLQHKLPKIDYLAFEGSGLKHLRKNDVKKLKLKVPENKFVTSKILSILRNLDTSIEKTEVLIEKYQQIKAGLMHDLFTRGIGPDRKLRPAREIAPRLYRETKIGWIPIDWKVERFDSITNIITCGVAATPEYVEPSIGVPFLSAQNVNSGKIILNRVSYIPPMLHRQLTKNTKPQKFDILYSRVGAGYGEAAVVEFDWEFSVYVSLTLVRMKKGYDHYFYKYLLNSNPIKNRASIDVFQGGGVPNLNVKVVREFLLPVPNHNEQLMIADALKVNDKKIDTNISLLKKLNALRSGLMNDLLTGKVQVPINNFELHDV